MVEIHNETKLSPPIWRLVFLQVACIGGKCGMTIFYYFLFVLAQKETKKPRKNEASTRKASPVPAIFPGRCTWIANNSAIFLCFMGLVTAFSFENKILLAESIEFPFFANGYYE